MTTENTTPIDYEAVVLFALRWDSIPMLPAEIAEQEQITATQVRRALRRLYAKQKVAVNPNGYWRLINP